MKKKLCTMYGEELSESRDGEMVCYAEKVSSHDKKRADEYLK